VSWAVFIERCVNDACTWAAEHQFMADDGFVPAVRECATCHRPLSVMRQRVEVHAVGGLEALR
jgi:recombinational DNA repair protein (RecF pathway)